MSAFLVAIRAFVAGLVWRLWAILAALVVVLVTGWSLHHAGFVEGAATATTTIKDANDAARGKADRAQTPVDRCYGSGGTWDRARGVCHQGTPRQ